jgi:hypothetical protein
LLQIDPEFSPNETADPTELLLLAEKFDTDPKFFWGIKLGAAYNLVQVIEPTLNYNTSLGPGTYSFSTSLGGGLFFQYPINERMSANAEVYFISRSLTLIKEAEANTEQSNTQTTTEQHRWLELPLLFNYSLLQQPFLLEATGGPSFHYLLDANLSSEGTGTPLNNINKLDRRNMFNVSALAGFRANFKILGKSFITLSLLYQHRLLKEVNYQPDYTQEEEDARYDSSYADGQYKGHAVWLKLGIRIPYYKPELK